MRTNELILYRYMEHEDLLRDMTFLIDNADNDYYNKEDLKSLLAYLPDVPACQQ